MFAFVGQIIGGSSSHSCVKQWTRGMPPPPKACTALSTTTRSKLVTLTMNAKSKSEDQQVINAAHSPTIDKNSTVRAYVRQFDTALPPNNQESADMSANVRRFETTGLSAERKALLDKSQPDTRAVHGGERPKGGKKARATLDAITTPIVQSSTFTFRNTRECIEYNEGLYESFEYGRYGNPTTRAAEEKLMALEKTEDALLSSSGMNAVTTMLLALVPEGGHIVTTTDCYRRTRQFVQTVLPKMGVRCTIIDPSDVNMLEHILKTEGASLFFSESPTNPMIRVIDAAAICKLCKKYNTISCIDTTFATAFNFTAADHGADLILHSGTKYLSGHNDVICGALAGRADLVKKVRALHGVLGGTVDPHSAFLLLRGMKTLGLRMEAHNRNALALAKFLETHPKISRVHYPALKQHQDYEVAKKSFGGKLFGGVLSFEIVGNGDPWSRETFEATGRFVDALRIPYIGPSLGGVESLVEQVCIMGYYDQALEIRQRLGINNGFIRYACGIEAAEDLIADVAQALEHA